MEFITKSQQCCLRCSQYLSCLWQNSTAIRGVRGPTKWAGEFAIRSLALGTPFPSELMHCCLFTQTHLLPSSGCAKLILSEALTLSWATMSGGAGGKKGAPCAAPSSAVFRVSTPLVKSPQPWKKKRTRGGGGRKNQNRICMHKIQHICSHGNHSACHSLVKPHQGRWGPLFGPWWAWLPGTHPAPSSSLWPTSRSFTTLLFLFNSHSARFFIANHTTNDHHGSEKRRGIMQCSTEAWLLWFLWIGGGVWD